MASPVGHTLIGLSLFLWRSAKPGPVAPIHRRLLTPQAAVFVLLANLPDMDFLISWLMTGDPNRHHSGWTHSLAFAIIAAVVAASFWRIEPGYWKSVLIGLAAVGSHSVVDFFTGPVLGFSPSYGVPWLAPFTLERFRSPVSLFVGPRHQGLGQIFSLHNWAWAAAEAMVLTPVVWLLLVRQKRKGTD
ncbi:MAG: metal-dependent hydrolase [Nitrospirota bacterium]